MRERASQIGMVFAASAVTTLINQFNAKVIIFTGVGGGMKPGQQALTHTPILPTHSSHMSQRILPYMSPYMSPASFL